ncbi:diguanylate cyclase domain-containing protein [Shewanella sp. GXUN23E]|uniref:GGDEF domain-containing protein n=1 Tax=Shewanella sp. GXUN23E TaxID=3422498 RepID=UPI003D7D3889
MKDSNQDKSQLAALTQKVNETRAALEELKEEKNAKLQTLLNFFQHLSLVCKGQNLELDNKLAKLRRQMTGFESLDEALPDIVEVERLLKRQYSLITRELEQGRNDLTRMTQQIQRFKFAPEQLKKELSYFRQELTKPLHSIWEYLPKIEKLISFYEILIDSQIQQPQGFDTEPRHRQLAQELAGMIADIDFPDNQKSHMLVLQEQLLQDAEPGMLLEAYQTVLSLLLENIAREKNASREFLFALNDALTAVQAVVDDSAESHQRHAEVKSRLNASINSQMAGMGKSVTEASELAELKELVTRQLTQIKDTLARKEALEQREQVMMQKSIDAMQKELTELSREACSYKERLFEQQKISQLDPLTQLPNRAALEEKLEQSFHKLQRTGQSYWLAVVDIDHFKTINDNFGHSTGDKTLQVIAMALKNALRDTEFVARYGGEEFVLLIPDVATSDIEHLLNRVREKIKSIPFKFKNQRITVTVSIGAAQLSVKETVSDTFDRADVALYQAKNTTRDKVVVDV